MKDVEKKYIIFGAGDYGSQALEYYGKEKIEYFADNSIQKNGRFKGSIEIISFEKYLSVQADYNTVIAIHNFLPIAEQLLENGIISFEIFSPIYTPRLKKISEKIPEGRTIFLGFDKYTEFVVREIDSNEKITNFDIAVRSIDYEENMKMLDRKIWKIEEITGQIDNIVISSEIDHAALYVFAKREFPAVKNIFDPFQPEKYYETKDIIYSRYKGIHDTTEDEWINGITISEEKSLMNSYVDELAKKVPLFEHIEIETINRCNGVCDFCPVSAGNDIRKKVIMEEELFYSIIDQLSALNYNGRLALFSNNEPFLDSRIVDFNSYARKKLPDARMHLFTNGTLLTLEKFIEIIEYLDELIIDNYNQELNLLPNLKVIKEYCEDNPILKEKVTIVMRKPHEILTSRGGDAPNRKKKIIYEDIKCALPFKQMIVRPDGKISLCCNDPYGRCTLGDLKTTSIKDIWYGNEFERVRQLLAKGRGEFEHCRYCDSFIIF